MSERSSIPLTYAPLRRRMSSKRKLGIVLLLLGASTFYLHGLGDKTEFNGCFYYAMAVLFLLSAIAHATSDRVCGRRTSIDSVPAPGLADAGLPRTG